MRIFLIAPYDKSGKQIQDSIRSSLQGIDDDEVELITHDDDFQKAVSDTIGSSDLVIADVSRNFPNVFYELGLAHALRKPTILLVNSHIRPQIPSDLAHMFYQSYDPDDLSSLKSYLRHNVMSYAGRKAKR
jgi:nucleoside 2-deoxyribosyltransferase